MNNLLSDVINSTFTHQVGKNQERKEVQQALLVRFSSRINYDTEEGYRHVDLVLYAPYNYVQVWVRERWNVIPLEDLEDDGNGDTYVKRGKNYQEGASDWRCIGDHDSCWREAVQSFLKDKSKEITGFEAIAVNDWYSVVPHASLNLPQV
jgi:hypothetical protein